MGKAICVRKQRRRINAHWRLLLTTANLALVKSALCNTMLMHSVQNWCKKCGKILTFPSKVYYLSLHDAGNAFGESFNKMSYLLSICRNLENCNRNNIVDMETSLKMWGQILLCSSSEYPSAAVITFQKALQCVLEGSISHNLTTPTLSWTDHSTS